MKHPVSDLPLTKVPCKTCPFKLNVDGHYQDAELASTVTEMNLFTSQQICHGTEGKDRKPRNRCRGSFDHNFEIYEKLGMDPAKNFINSK